MIPKTIPMMDLSSADRKRKSSSSALRSESAGRGTKSSSRTEKMAKLLAVEELGCSRRRCRTSEDGQVLDLAAVKLWRQRVVQWFFDVVDHFNLPRDVVYVSAEILDSYTASLGCSIISNSHYQEVSIASIFLATRMLKTRPPRFTMETFLMETMGSTCNMTASQAMEVVRKVSATLDLTYPILPPSVFVMQLVGITQHLLPRPPHRETAEALEHILYLTELAVIADLPAMLASDIALAAMMQTFNPKTGPAGCSMTEERFQLLTEELENELNLDFSNGTIQTICTKLGHIYADSLVCRSSGEEPRATSSGPAPVLIEEDPEEDEAFCDTESNNDIEEYNNEDVTQSPAKRLRTN